MKSTKKRMSNVSGTIKDVAKRIQNEDERAAERAKLLPSGGGGGGSR